MKDVKSITMCKHKKEKNIMEKRLLIRHDIDHDPLTAEKMAVIESDNNLSATYFVLHTAPYFKNKFKKTMEICRNIQSMGHEIGLHNDLITDFFMNNKEPKKNLTFLLELFEEEGIKISGTAAHGSRLIQNLNHKLNSNYYFPYANYLVFSEMIEKSLEKYPGKIQPSNPRYYKKELHLPCINMTKIGLLYECYFTSHNYYVSDTARRFWSTGDDPIKLINKLGKVETLQCLFHPIWWKYYLD